MNFNLYIFRSRVDYYYYDLIIILSLIYYDYLIS
jgi:hypothetical protein